MGVSSQHSSPPHASHLTTHLLIPRYSNVDLQTQEAYEMAVRGSIRPMNKSPMLITGIRCLHFAPPEFLLGKLSWEVGAGRWSSWFGDGALWNAVAEASTSQPQSLLASFLPSLGLGLVDHIAHRTNAVLSPAKSAFEARP